MKEYVFEFKNGNTILKLSVKAENQDLARSAVTYLLNSVEKFDFTLVEIIEHLQPLPLPLYKKICEASVVYLDGKTIKDRYMPEEISDVPIFDMFNILEIESWNEEEKILKLITVGRK